MSNTNIPVLLVLLAEAVCLNCIFIMLFFLNLKRLLVHEVHIFFVISWKSSSFFLYMWLSTEDSRIVLFARISGGVRGVNELLLSSFRHSP